MSQRETLKKPFVMPRLHGVNERLVATELPLSDFSVVEGVFPQYMGMQARNYGKRLLQRYEAPIYGMFQFWTPVGYAGGVYQFDSEVDFGAWITPTSNIVIPTLPPAVGFDGGGMTLDDFGNPYGGPIGEPNVCSIGFVGENSAHEQCGDAPSNVGTPDDTNGGPAGQGKRCFWSEGDDEDFVLPTLVSIEWGEYFDSTNNFEGPLPYPVYPTKSQQPPTVFTPGAGPYGSILAAYYHVTSNKTNLGFGNYLVQQGSDSGVTRAIISFAGILDPDRPPVSVEFKVQHNGNPPFVVEYQPIGGLTISDDGNYLTFLVNTYDFLIPNYFVGPSSGGGGFIYGDFVVIQGIRVKYDGRVCV